MSDRDGVYKVSYYITASQNVAFRWFKTFKEASDFAVNNVKTGDVLEIKRYENES